MSNIQNIQLDSYRWVHVPHPGQEEANYLKNTFYFHDLDIEDCLTISHRSNIIEHTDYTFVTLIFPVYNKMQGMVEASELNFFIGKDFFITVTDDKIGITHAIFEKLQNDKEFFLKFKGRSKATLMQYIIQKCINRCYPLLDTIAQDTDDAEDLIFKGFQKEMVHNILIVKRNITNFRKIIISQKKIIRRLSQDPHGFLQLSDQDHEEFNNTIETIKNVWDVLDSHRETIFAIHQTNESLISFRLNDIMKLLTIISVTVLPINLMASIFGMNTTFTPFVSEEDGFWKILAIMAIIVVILVYIFRRKKWLS